MFLRRALFLVRLARAGKPVERTDDVPGRVRNEAVIVLGQSKLLQRIVPGLMHAFVFWGFLVLFPTIVMAMISAVDQDATLPWSREVLSLIEEIAIERLPGHLTERLRELRAEREQRQADEAAAEQARAAAIAELREQLPAMPASQRPGAVRELEAEHGWSSEASALYTEIRGLEQAEAEAALGGGEDDFPADAATTDDGEGGDAEL